MIDTLLDAARPLIRVERCWGGKCPSVSVAVYNPHEHVVLALKCVVVRVDADDLLPVECEGTVPAGDDGEVRLRFSMPQVGWRDGKRVVTYDCEVVDG